MIIQINGTNTVNKGAELMLYAILQEIEKKYPEAHIRYTGNYFEEGYINSPLRFENSWKSNWLIDKIHMWGLIRRLLSVELSPKYRKYEHVDILFDASGYCYSDTFRLNKVTARAFEASLRNVKINNGIIVFLPQSFGPFTGVTMHKIKAALLNYSDFICARDLQSYQYISISDKNTQDSPSNFYLFPDFTIKVNGYMPTKYEGMNDYVTLIPNYHMASSKKKKKQYVKLLSSLISICHEKGKKAFLLNHESGKDYKLCKEIAKAADADIISGLNALEIKGFIANSYLVFSSRFHGAISSLNSRVPCLSTSWSFKYEELFMAYHIEDFIVDIYDEEECIRKFVYLLDVTHNMDVRKKLEIGYTWNYNETEKMWGAIWNFVDNHLGRD